RRPRSRWAATNACRPSSTTATPSSSPACTRAASRKSCSCRSLRCAKRSAEQTKVPSPPTQPLPLPGGRNKRLKRPRREGGRVKLNRRSALAGAAALSVAPAVRAQDFPNKPIKIVVPFAAGSATDLAARGLGAKLQEILKQPIIVDDKPGANGQLGASAVATAPGDGYTLMMCTNSTNAANVALFKKLSYDPEKDFAPIARCITGVNALVVNPDLPLKTISELIAYARQNPGKLNYSEASASQRLSAEMFNSMAGIKI